MSRKTVFIFFLVMILLLTGGAYREAPRQIRVGAYENPPKIFSITDGTIEGFWPTILSDIAKRENWQIVWVKGSWEECLDRLAKNEIDMMVDVGVTDARKETFTFSQETVLTSWARIYVAKESGIQTILDLEGKKIAGLTGALNFDGPEGIKALVEKFGVKATFVGYASYAEVFEAVQSGKADAGVTNKDFGDSNELQYQLVKTPIIIQPTQLTFAFPINGALTAYLKAHIDTDLKLIKADEKSIYYQALDTYFGIKSTGLVSEKIPMWVPQAAFVTLGILLFLFAVSVTSRVQVARQTKKLKESESHYRSLFVNNPDHVLWLSPEGGLLDYHPSSGETLIQNRSTLMDDHVFNGLPEELQKQFLEIIKETIENQEVRLFEFDLQVDGELRNYESRFISCENDKVIAFVRNITSRKMAEKELQESEKRYETLTKVTPVGIFRTDIDGKTTFVNNTWSKISGLSYDEALGDGWLDAVHPDDKELLASNWEIVTSLSKTSTADYRFIHKDGSEVWVIGQAVPEYNANNELVGYVGTITDITERKKIEELKVAVAKAESADKLKSAFLATMSHELRTPLNSIIGFTGILLQKLVGPLSVEQEKQLKMVQSSALHLLNLINDVLDISKIEADQVTIIHEDFEITSVYSQCLEKIQPMAVTKGLKLSKEIKHEPLNMISDKRRVEQILINLLNNAVKFTESGEVVLKSEIDGANLRISIQDTGIGITPENIQTLFMPFKQIDTGLTRKYEGTGLGLSICKRLVELLGGTIWVESELGKGSSFIFTLPLQWSKNE
jgi:PAS domain S-box-containing protein